MHTKSSCNFWDNFVGFVCQVGLLGVYPLDPDLLDFTFSIWSLIPDHTRHWLRRIVMMQPAPSKRCMGLWQRSCNLQYVSVWVCWTRLLIMRGHHSKVSRNMSSVLTLPIRSESQPPVSWSFLFWNKHYHYLMFILYSSIWHRASLKSTMLFWFHILLHTCHLHHYLGLSTEGGGASVWKIQFNFNPTYPKFIPKELKS